MNAQRTAQKGRKPLLQMHINILYCIYSGTRMLHRVLNGQNRCTHKVRTYKEYHSVCPSSELGLPPTPHPQASVPPPPCFLGEGNTRWRERGWESPNSDEGHTLWYSLYVRTLWLYPVSHPSYCWGSYLLVESAKCVYQGRSSVLWPLWLTTGWIPSRIE